MARAQRMSLLLALYVSVCPVCVARGADAVTPSPGPRLVLVRSIPLSVPAPSDLCLDRDGVHAWTVSDQTGFVYRLRLADGAVTATLRYRGEDPEGIWQDPRNGSLYVTEERTRQVVHMDSTGRVIGRVTIAGLGGKANSGLEGITFSPVTGRFYVVQEKRPARLVEADSTGHVVALHPVDYLLDLSGLTYDSEANELLIISDQSERISRVGMDGVLVSSWDTGVKNGEGIALDRSRGRIYVVSDSEGKFYEFQVPWR